MLELGISQAQTQFTKILNQATLIVNKKAHTKKAVILPYSEYRLLVSQNRSNKSSFSRFAGVLKDDFYTTDARYNEIVK